MKNLATITALEVLGEKVTTPTTLTERRAARAVITRMGEVALLHIPKNAFYKLAGGGIEEGENIIDALTREIREETGLSIAIVGEVGMTEEVRAESALCQISYCYYGEVTGEVSETTLTDFEKDQNLTLVWAKDIDEAIVLVEQCKPENYAGKFIRYRDLLLLKEYREITA